MIHREPMDRADRFRDEIFNGTGTITTCVHDLKEIASALQALGIPAGDDAVALLEVIRGHAERIASAFGGYVHAQANGTLYQPLASPHTPTTERANV